MIKVVLDTNILISSIFWKGTPRQVVDLAATHEILSVTSAEILQETAIVLTEDFTGVPPEKIHQIIKDILSYSEVILPRKITLPPSQLRDVTDTKILACAVSGNVNYLITGDKDLLVLKNYQGIPIITARTFLDLTG